MLGKVIPLTVQDFASDIETRLEVTPSIVVEEPPSTKPSLPLSVNQYLTFPPM